MATLTIKDLLNKIVKIFPQDIYVLNNTTVLGGVESENSRDATMLIELHPEAISIIGNTYPTANNNNIYISNIRNYKKDIADNIENSDNLSLNISDDEISKLTKKKDELTELFTSKDIKWTTFNISESKMKSLFNECDSVKLFENNDKIPSLIVSKSVFPSITEKNINAMYYSVILPDDDDENEVYKLLTKIDSDLFMLYSLIQFVDIDN